MLTALPRQNDLNASSLFDLNTARVCGLFSNGRAKIEEVPKSYEAALGCQTGDLPDESDIERVADQDQCDTGCAAAFARSTISQRRIHS